MKKNQLVFSVVAGFLSICVGCGPSAEEKAAVEKAQQDSINAVMEQKMAEQKQAMEDSINAAKAAEEEAARQKQAIEDSLKAAMEKSTKPKTKPKSDPKPKAEPTPTKPADVKPGQGRG
jgi:predicted Fe-S protein YdhL (DUF1289 family)